MLELYPAFEQPGPGVDMSIIGSSSVAGMKHLREQGIVHRDLKPGNIMRVGKEDGRLVEQEIS